MSLLPVLTDAQITQVTDRANGNVRAYGLTSTAITSALAAADWETGRTGALSLASGGHVYLPTGTYTVAAEIATNNTWWGRISGERSTVLKPTAALDSMLYMDGNGFFELDHLRFTESLDVPPTHLVQDVVLIDRTDAALNSVHDSKIHDLDIIGTLFVRGITVGKNSGTHDIAQLYYDGLQIFGDWTAGNTTTYQEAMHLGSGSYGNILNFDLKNIGIAKVRYPVVVDNLNAHLDNINIGYAEAAISGNPRFTFDWDGGYAEVCDRLLHFPGIDSYPRQMSVKNIHVSPSGVTNEFVLLERSGNLLLENISWYNPYYPTTKAQIVTGGTTGRTITFRNFTAAESPEEIWTDLASAWQNIRLIFEDYTQIDPVTFAPIQKWAGMYYRVSDGDGTEKLQYMPYDGLFVMDTDVFGFAQPVYLPDPAFNAGRHVYIQRKGGHNVTITAQAGDTIGIAGATTLVLTTDGQCAHLVSDGVSNWEVLE